MAREVTAESVVLVDENNLDKECVRLPGDYLKFATLAADHKRKLDEVSNRCKLIAAEVSKEIRTSPEKFGLDGKVTEAGITSAINAHERTLKGQERLRDAQHQYDLAQAVVWALEHKKRTLTLLVELHGMGYFSEVKTSKVGKEVIQEMAAAKARGRGRHVD